MVRLLALIALAGCGRIGFDVASKPDDSGAGGDVLTASDVDGDGVPDAVDTCPYLAAPQLDGDGDGVGDACDPNPAVARDRIMLFATMVAGDQPLTLGTTMGGATWSEVVNGLALDGNVSTSFYAGATMPLALASDIRVAIVFDILQVGGSAFQHQFSISTITTLPNYLAELNEQLGSYSNTEITRFDGTNFFLANGQALASGIHPGTILFVLTERIGTNTHVDISWPGEPYSANVNDAQYQGSQLLQFNINNLRLVIRALCVITST